MNTLRISFLSIFMLILSSCISAGEMVSAQSEIRLIEAADTLAPGLEATPTPTLEPTPEPDPYSLETLKNRTYGDGDFVVDRHWYSYDLFDRYYVIYDSDGLSIHGFVNVPVGEGPFPVVIMLHGYIPPEEYVTLDYTTRYADALAKQGYIVLHPNLRNFPPSDTTERRRDSNTGYTIDVLNLLAYLREMKGPEQFFASADLTNIGIWGHSIGGSIAMRTMSVEPGAFKAAVLYGAVSQRYATVLEGAGIYDFSEVETAISIHHGEDDAVISAADSRKLCSQLEQIGKQPECYFYEGQPHTFNRDQWADPLFTERTLEFFNAYL